MLTVRRRAPREAAASENQGKRYKRVTKRQTGRVARRAVRFLPRERETSLCKHTRDPLGRVTVTGARCIVPARRNAETRRLENDG